MTGNYFTEDDVKKVVDFLNFIATRASFKDWSTADTVTHFKLLQHMQLVVLSKMESHVLEVKSIKQMDNKSAAEDTSAPSAT